MKRFIRITGLAFALLLFFLAALVVVAGWLNRQNEQQRQSSIAGYTRQLDEILDLCHAPPPPWNSAMAEQINRALGARVVFKDPTSFSRSYWVVPYSFKETGTGEAPRAWLLVRPPQSVHAMAVFQRVAAIMLLVALLLLGGMVILVMLDRDLIPAAARIESESSDTSQIGMISHLAHHSALQSIELEKEREERQRAEADAHLKQILLNRALQEKIDMGRDLHDGLIQSLYATGLTIQAGRRALERDNDTSIARGQIDTALLSLNNAIREVRAYISGLGAEHVRQHSFTDSLRTVIDNLRADRPLDTDLRIDEQAVEQLDNDQTTDLLQITREAVSNALRHGHARQITIRLHRHGNETCLLIQDNGRGFDSTLVSRGHGLDNMQARAQRLKAKLHFESTLNQGTRLVLTITAPEQ